MVVLFAKCADHLQNVVRGWLTMSINELCYVKNAEVISSSQAENSEQSIELTIFNQILKLKEMADLSHDQDENGVLLTLWCPESEKEYVKFMPKSLIQKLMGEGYPELTRENLEFFAGKLKEREHPLTLTLVTDKKETLTDQPKIKIVGNIQQKGN